MTASGHRSPPDRQRGAVALIEDGRIAVIERQRGTDTWYLLPGGGTEGSETVEQAAIRETKEEIGLDVTLGGVVAEVWFESAQRTTRQVYFRAARAGGVFGPGAGNEYLLPADHPSGTYRPVWLDLAATEQLDVRPSEVFAALRTTGIDELETSPLTVDEEADFREQRAILYDAVVGRSDEEIETFARSIGGEAVLLRAVLSAVASRIVAEPDANVVFDFEGELRLLVSIQSGVAAIHDQPSEVADATVCTSPADFLRVMTRDLDLDTAIEDGRVLLNGETTRAKLLVAQMLDATN